MSVRIHVVAPSIIAKLADAIEFMSARRRAQDKQISESVIERSWATLTRLRDRYYDAQIKNITDEERSELHTRALALINQRKHDRKIALRFHPKHKTIASVDAAVAESVAIFA